MLGTAWMVNLTLPPYLISHAIDDGLQPGHYSQLLGWVAALLAVGLLNAGLAILRHRTLTKVRMNAAFRTVHAVVVKATELGGGLTRSVTAGEVVTIGIGDVWTISTSLTFVGPGVGGVVAYLVVAVLLLEISPVLALVVLLGAPLVAIAIGPVLARLRRVGMVYREHQGGLTSQLVDIVEGLQVLNGLGGKPLFVGRYHERSQRLQREGYRVGSVSSWIPALGAGLPMLFLACVTWLAARMAAQHSISIGELIAVYGYVAMLVVPIAELIDAGLTLSQSMVSAGRVLSVLTLQREDSGTLAPPAHPADLADPDSGVVIRAGRFTALTGSRPADAAEILDRLGGFSPSRATWGDVPLAAIEPGQLRREILMADNEADIFAGTLREVVSGRWQPTDEAILRALHTAAAVDIIEALPDGLASRITAQARNLSGGQRQRVRLVRALLAEPTVLLAVEPTSAVDAHTEAAIGPRLREARAGRTTVLATSSPLLLGQADEVHWLVDGQVVASGSHAELLATDSYAALISRDLADDELGDELGDEPGDEPGDDRDRDARSPRLSTGQRADR
jgi:ABC-type bacteriocin/lantibiotic exporter with double-glycine peptidase domain